MYNTVPIAFAFDDHMAKQALTTITSLLENKNEDTFCDIYIFSNDISNQSETALNNLESNYTNFRVNKINPKEAYADAYQGHLTTPNYYRFLIPTHLKFHSKAIWCDVDIIITSDLYHLIRDFDKNAYIMAVKGTSIPTRWIRSKESEGKRIAVNYNKYFNAGFYVIDIKKTIEDNLTEKISSYIYGNKFCFPTQDVMNLTYANKISFLPLKYNLTIGYFKNTICLASEKLIRKKYKELIRMTSYKEVKEAIDNPVIIHFNGKRKPWLEFNPLNRYHFIWYHYYLKVMHFNPKIQEDFFMVKSTEVLNKKDMFKWASAVEFNDKRWLLKEIIKKYFTNIYP